MENENVTAEAVEAAEFPHLSQRYAVMAVPKTVINETKSIEGAVPEEALVAELKQASGM